MITREFNEVIDNEEPEKKKKERKMSRGFSLEDLDLSRVSNSIETEEEEYENGNYKRPAFYVRRPWNTFITIDQVTQLFNPKKGFGVFWR